MEVERLVPSSLAIKRDLKIADFSAFSLKFWNYLWRSRRFKVDIRSVE